MFIQAIPIRRHLKRVLKKWEIYQWGEDLWVLGSSKSSFRVPAELGPIGTFTACEVSRALVKVVSERASCSHLVYWSECELLIFCSRERGSHFAHALWDIEYLVLSFFYGCVLSDCRSKMRKLIFYVDRILMLVGMLLVSQSWYSSLWLIFSNFWQTWNARRQNKGYTLNICARKVGLMRSIGPNLLILGYWFCLLL